MLFQGLLSSNQSRKLRLGKKIDFGKKIKKSSGKDRKKKDIIGNFSRIS